MEKVMKIWARISTVVIISCFSFIVLGILLVVLIMGGGSLYGAQLNIFELLTLTGMYGSAFLFIFLFFLLKNFILIPLFYYAWIKSKKYEKIFKILAHISYVFFILFFVIDFYDFSDFDISSFSFNCLLLFAYLPIFYYAWRKEPKVINQLPADISISIDDITKQ